MVMKSIYCIARLGGIWRGVFASIYKKGKAAQRSRRARSKSEEKKETQ